MAQAGIMPEGYACANRELVEANKEKEEPRLPVMPVLGVNTNFSKVTAVTLDGTEFTAEVKRGEVIEGEAMECA